jgi:hypothetical protein
MIWKNHKTGKYYLIPESIILISGSLELTTPVGKTRFVETTTVHPFEVSEQEAREWLMQQTGDFLEKVRHALPKAVEEGLEKACREMEEIEQSISESQTAEANNHATEWNDLLQKLSERFGQEGDDTETAATRGAHSFITELFGVIIAAASSDSSRLQQSVIRAERLEALLNDLNLSTEGMISGLPEKIEALIHNSKESADQQDPADTLERLAKTIENNTASIVERLRQAAIELRKSGKAAD